jgi:hypothetical protein
LAPKVCPAQSGPVGDWYNRLVVDEDNLELVDVEVNESDVVRLEEREALEEEFKELVAERLVVEVVELELELLEDTLEESGIEELDCVDV